MPFKLMKSKFHAHILWLPKTTMMNLFILSKRSVKLIKACSTCYRQFSRWRHLTTTTTIQFVFLFIFKFCIPSGVKITIALVDMTHGVIMQMSFCRRTFKILQMTLFASFLVDISVWFIRRRVIKIHRTL